MMAVSKCKFLNRAAVALLALSLLLSLSDGAAAQDGTPWTPQERIPGYDDEATPPQMVVDSDGTVHAFLAQPVGEEDPEIGIVYRQWTEEQGWSTPVDVVLSPLKRQLRLLDVFLDQTGFVHLIFFGGDETQANIYHTSAPILHAGEAPAWSEPLMIGESAVSPSTGSLYGDANGNLVVVYSGRIDGNGLYTTFSANAGATWSDPVNMWFSGSDKLWPWNLQIMRGSTGTYHAIWNVVDVAGQGRAIYYAQLKPGEIKWRTPVELGRSDSGLGLMTPTIAEHEGTLFAIYNSTPKIVMRTSRDDGERWTPVVELFGRHVGVNGSLSTVIDGQNTLHIFFGQRISGSPDIHGMWHSRWQGSNWSEPEAVVSGPQINDVVSDTAFDPYNASAVAVLGNTLLSTWQSDPGMKGNGIWYSFRRLDFPASPRVPVPSGAALPAPTAVATRVAPLPTPTAQPVVLPAPASAELGPAPYTADNPTMPLLIGIASVLPLIAVIFVRMLLMRQHGR